MVVSKSKIHLHTFLAVMACLVALQWLNGWTFLMALALLSSLALHFYVVTEPRASRSVTRDPSHKGTAEPAESSHLSRTG